jgi:PLD-like domain
MHRLLSQRLWPTVRKLSAKSGVKMAAVSYVTSDKYVTFGDDDVLIVDASDSAIGQGQTDALILEQAFERGADLYSYPGLHAKLMVLNGHAVVGSANLSVSSVESLVEVALVTDQPSIVGKAISIISNLKQASDRIDESFIERIKTIEVTARIGGNVARKPRPTESFEPRTWIVGIHAMVRDFADEESAITKGQEIAEQVLTDPTSDIYWLRFTGKSRFRSEARAGDNVITIWRDANEKIPSNVYKHSLILLRQEESRCTRFYVEEPSDHEDTILGWDEFLKLVQRIGVVGRIGPSSARLLKDAHSEALFSLWGA